MVVNIEALFVVVEKLLLINIHLNQLNEVYPRNKNDEKKISFFFFESIQFHDYTLFDNVGETIVVPFCK